MQPMLGNNSKRIRMICRKYVNQQLEEQYVNNSPQIS
jgi:hypothetical protein